MKKYIRANTRPVIRLEDAITDNVVVVICDDVFRYNRSVINASTLYDYTKFSTEQLLAKDDEFIHGITDEDTLVRIAKEDSSRLSESQLFIVKQLCKSDYRVDKKSVKEILEILKTKKRAAYFPTKKNEKFLAEHDVSTDDMLYAVQHLTVGDYVAHKTDYIEEYIDDVLIVFEPTRKLPLKNGGTIENTIIYLKIDIDQSDGSTVFLLSFHDTNREDYKPYK